MSAITIQGLTKRFGRTTAVDAVDLEIESGALFFLLGPSGCGKTTLLRLIAGFITPSAGRIAFGARDVTTLAPNRRHTGMVFQSYALWPHMTVSENVAYGLRVRRVAARERTARVTKTLDTVRMREYADRKPNELSGGQQQRVALARALVIEPTVLLLDEPLSNLDANLRLEMRSEIRRICADTGITTVYVTHDQKEALSMADQVAVLRDGRVAQIGPPRALYERPGSTFVAGFLGETNLIPATITGRDARGLRLETAGGPLHANANADDAPKSGKVTLSVRPEALRIGAGAAEPNCLSGTRAHSVYLGEVAQHVVDLPDGTSVKVLELRPGPFASPGAPIRLAIRAEDVVVLSG